MGKTAIARNFSIAAKLDPEELRIVAIPPCSLQLKSDGVKINRLSASELIKLQPGAHTGKRSEYKIHKALLNCISSELSSLVDNEGVLVLQDVDGNTVQRFLDWVYIGKYKTVGLEYVDSIVNKTLAWNPQKNLPISILVDR